MKIRVNGTFWLSIAFFILTIQNSQVFIDWNIDEISEYVGLLILLVGCTISVYRMNVGLRRQLLMLFFACVILLCAGLIRQELATSKIIYLCISYILLAYIAIFPNAFLSSQEVYKKMAKAVLVAVVISTILALCTGTGVTTTAHEGILSNYGFNGGMEHKNYYAYSMLGCYILYDLDKTISSRNGKGVLFLTFILMALSNSRSVFVVFLVYYIVSNYKKWKIQGHGKRISLFLTVMLIVLIGVPAYKYMISHSQTFSFRLNGLTNYMNYLNGDWNRIIFGNASIAFADTGRTYSQNIRSVIGWDGSVELVVLNVMIKSGLLGIIAFAFFFVNSFCKIKKMQWKTIESRTYAVFFSFVVSALVEGYVGNLNLMYSPLCYIFLATFPYLQEGGYCPLKNKAMYQSTYFRKTHGFRIGEYNK